MEAGGASADAILQMAVCWAYFAVAGCFHSRLCRKKRANNQAQRSTADKADCTQRQKHQDTASAKDDRCKLAERDRNVNGCVKKLRFAFAFARSGSEAMQF